MFLHSDMTARDLLQKRSTGPKGETIWLASPVVAALTHGRLLILDGLHRLAIGTFAVLIRLLEDGEVATFDGTRFVSDGRYMELQAGLGLSPTQLAAKGIYRVHPAFRVVALATPPKRHAEEWLANELMHAFDFHEVNSEYPNPKSLSTLTL